MSDDFIPAKTLTESERWRRAQMESIKTYQAELSRLRHEIKALRAAIQCERETGTCVAVHDPERAPCTAKNCKFMAALGEQR